MNILLYHQMPLLHTQLCFILNNFQVEMPLFLSIGHAANCCISKKILLQFILVPKRPINWVWAISSNSDDTVYIVRPHIITRIALEPLCQSQPSFTYSIPVTHEKMLIEKSKECHNHKQLPTPYTKSKRKRTKTNTCKTNKQMHEKHTDQLPLLQVRWSQC